MQAYTPITVSGPPVDAWFTACMLARFAPIESHDILVLEDPRSDDKTATFIARPEMARIHASLGLDVRRMDARPVQVWPAKAGRSIPFGPIGTPLKGAGFAALWCRARAELGETRGLDTFAALTPSGAYALDTRRYRDALRQIATTVGVRTVSEARGGLIRTGAIPEALAEDDSINIGAAALDLRLAASLRLLALEKTVRILIDCWPWRGADQAVSAREFNRQLAAAKHSIDDMQALLEPDGAHKEQSVTLRQRIDVWRAAARIAPIDDDLFRSAEWMMAMVAAGFVPDTSGRLAQRVSQAELKAHMDTCAQREVTHAV